MFCQPTQAEQQEQPPGLEEGDTLMARQPAPSHPARGSADDHARHAEMEDIHTRRRAADAGAEHEIGLDL